MTLAEDPQPSRALGELQHRHAEDDARRLELITWLERHGLGSRPWREIPAEVIAQARRELGHPAPAGERRPVVKTFRREPAPEIPPPRIEEAKRAEPPPGHEEEHMPRKEPAECCGTMGPRHKADCKEAGKTTVAKAVQAARPKPAAAPRPRATRRKVEEVEDLLFERAEALGRMKDLEVELADLDERIREALAAKKAELAKLEQAVAATTARRQAAAAAGA